MSDLMRNWIFPLIKDELTFAIEHFPPSSTSSRDVRGRSCQHNAGGFTLHLGVGKHLQVIDLHGNQDHAFHVTVSDGTTSIHAKLHDRNLADTARGSVVAVKDYYLVLGSEGSAPFGKPTTIWDQSAIGSLVGELRDLYCCDETRTPLRSGSASTLHLPQPCGSVEDKPMGMPCVSQAPFATQMQNTTDKERGMDTRNSGYGASTSKTHVLSALSELNNKSGVWQDGNITNTVPQPGSQTSILMIEKPIILSQVYPSTSLRISSGIAATAGVGQSRVPLSSQPSFGSSDQSPLSLIADNTYLTAVPAVPSDDSEKENKRYELEPEMVSVRVSQPDCPTLARNDELSKAPMQAVSPFLSDPFEGMKRVPRRYVQLSKSQHELLAHQDSWFKPAVDSRASYAIIPVQVQKDLAMFISTASSQNLVDRNQDVNAVSSEPSREYHSSVCEENCENCYSSISKQNLGIGDAQRSNGNVSPSPDRHLNMELSLQGCSPAVLSSDPEKIHVTSTKSRGDYRSAIRPESSDRESSPWSSSPEIHLTHTLASLERRRSPLPDDTSRLIDLGRHTNVEMSPRMTNVPELVNSPGGVSLESFRQAQSRRAPLVFPSSPRSEEDLELDVLHAMGEGSESSDENSPHTTEIPPHPPSTALQSPMLVQVEQTPALKTPNDNHTSFGLDSTIRVSKQRKRKRERELSSDPIIPATCDDASSIYPRISSPDDAGADSGPLPDVQYCDGEAQETILKTSDEATVDVGGTNEDFSAIRHNTTRIEQGVLTFNLEKDVRSSVSCIDSNRNSCTSHDLANQSDSPQAISTPPGTPSAGREHSIGKHPQNSLSPVYCLKRGIGTTDRDSKLAGPKRRRRMHAAASIAREECAGRDTKAMARAGRHMFNNQLSVIDPLHPIDWRRLHSEPGSEESPCSLERQPLTRNTSVGHSLGVFSSSSPSQLVESGVHTLKETPSQVPQTQTVSTAKRTVREIAPTTPIGANKSDEPLNLTEQGVGSSPDADIYVRFKASYPDYVGSRRGFTWALVYVEWLRNAKQLLHRSLCDDFIRVISSEYVEYASKIRSTGRKAMTGWSFYDKTVAHVKYCRGMVTPENLQDVLSTLDQDEVQRIRGQFNQPRTIGPTESCEKEILTPPDPPQQKVITVGGSTSKSARRLPWSKVIPALASSEGLRDQKEKITSSAPSPPLSHKLSKISPDSKSPEVNRGANMPRPFMLADVSEPSTIEPSKTRWIKSHASPSRDQIYPKTPSLSALRNVSSREDSQRSVITSTSKVEGWLKNRVEAVAEASSFKAFIKRRKPSSGFVSNKSTPSSTPERRFCTKAKQPTTEPKE